MRKDKAPYWNPKANNFILKQVERFRDENKSCNAIILRRLESHKKTFSSTFYNK